MKNSFAKKFVVCALAGVFGAAFIACGDDGSSSPSAKGLPAEVADKAELETYECGMDVIGEKVYVADLELNYECDGEKWFKSYDQTKPSSTSTKSSSSKKSDGGSSSSRVGKSSAKVPSSSSIAVDYNALCGATPYDSTTHFCDIRDSAVYAMVRIGSQVWMKENLNFDYKIDGASYGSYCYNNSADSCAKYGKLYTWAAATDSVNTGCGYVATWEGATCEVETDTLQGICPNGWHLPDTAEWSTLVAAVADDPVTAGATLKSETGWLDSDTPGTNSSGFSALPSGFRYNDGNFDYVGCYARFWLSSERKPDDAYDGGLSYLNARAYRFNDYKYYAFSVRCVKD